MGHRRRRGGSDLPAGRHGEHEHCAGNNPDYYSGTPIFYIYYMGTTPGGLGSVYQIDAAGFGGTANTAAVVESTFLVQSSIKDLGGL